MARLSLAFPETAPAPALLIGADAAADLSGFDPATTLIIQPLAGDHAALKARGWEVATRIEGQIKARIENNPFATVVVFWPRARAEGLARLAAGAEALAPQGALWVDGLKGDGIDGVLRLLRGFAPADPVIAKAHGKIFRLQGNPDWVPADWAVKEVEVAPGFITLPGVFSADDIDPGSAMLAAHLPEKLPTRIVDLGAGWGWLSAQILMRDSVQSLHLVENNADALACARRNVADPRARFHWVDARDFTLPEPVNGVIMNPPFHANRRKSDPDLGIAFIKTAARLLTGAGRLWMVANRHLPYEAALGEHFASVEEIGGDNRFKVITATGAGKGAARPVRRRSAAGKRRAGR